jgi:hypothetical protein
MGSGGGLSFFSKVFCFVALSHGPTGVKPGGGLWFWSHRAPEILWSYLVDMLMDDRAGLT